MPYKLTYTFFDNSHGRYTKKIVDITHNILYFMDIQQFSPISSLISVLFLVFQTFHHAFEAINVFFMFALRTTVS